MSNGNLPESATKSTLGRAVETNDPDLVETLNRAELTFYLCALLDIEPPEEHPAEYAGRVSRGLLMDIANAVAPDDSDGDDE